MKILVGQNHLDTIGGSETYTYTLIKWLVSNNHKVELLVGQENRLGIMSDKIEKELGIVANKLTGNYDACFLSHQSSVKSYISFLKGKPLNNVFQIIHGIIPHEEQPIIHDGLRYIAITQEVKNYLLNKYNLTSTYVSNFIDLERFKFKPIKENLKVILSLSQSEIFNEMLRKVTNKMGIALYYNNKHKNPIFNIEDKIYDADLVVSLGRGCYEAMACGRNVLVADFRNYMSNYSDGYLTDENYLRFHENNCSGRKMKISTTEEFLEKELKKYHKNMGYKLRKVAEKYLDVNICCNKLLKQIV